MQKSDQKTILRIAIPERKSKQVDPLEEMKTCKHLKGYVGSLMKRAETGQDAKHHHPMKLLCYNSYERRLVHKFAEQHNIPKRSVLDYRTLRVQCNNYKAEPSTPDYEASEIRHSCRLNIVPTTWVELDLPGLVGGQEKKIYLGFRVEGLNIDVPRQSVSWKCGYGRCGTSKPTYRVMYRLDRLNQAFQFLGTCLPAVLLAMIWQYGEPIDEALY